MDSVSSTKQETKSQAFFIDIIVDQFIENVTYCKTIARALTHFILKKMLLLLENVQSECLMKIKS